MHELGIAFHIIKELDKFAEDNKVDNIARVTLEIGEVSSVIPKYLEDVWAWAVENKSTHMKGCALNIIVIKAISYCDSCKKTYPTINGKKCPYCGSDNTWLVEGNEMKIKNIEVADKKEN